MSVQSKIYSTGVMLLLLFVKLSAQSQADDTLELKDMTLFKMQYFKENDYYLSTNNASGLTRGAMKNYSDVNLTYDYSKGYYRRPQQPEQSDNFLFSAEGAMAMDKMYLVGGFNFKEAFEKNVHFTSILDPYRGTPYIIADSTGGDWKKQTYDMWAKMASPVFFRCLTLGVDGRLAVGRGAKDIDPRPQANSNSIQVAPSFTLFKNNHSLGADFTYRRFRESSNLFLYDTGEPQKLYFLKGMGQYTYDVFSTTERERQYDGDGFGGGVQYAYQSNRLKIFLEGLYENYVENANDIENDKPRQCGRLYETSWKGTMHMAFYDKEQTIKQVLSVGFSDVKRSGREIIQVFNSSVEVNAWITAMEAPARSVFSLRQWNAGYNFCLLNRLGESCRWKFSLYGKLSHYSDEYAVMNSLIKFSDGDLSAKVIRNIYLRRNNFLQVGLDGGYRGVWNKTVMVTPREITDHTITDGLVKIDADILTQGYYHALVHAMYGYSLKSKNSIYVKGSIHYLRSEGKLSQRRYSLSVGYNF